MNEIRIHEVGLRDGLQIEKQSVPLEKKVEWVEALLAAGVGMIQLGSFVNPERVPQMADSDKLFAHFGQAGRKPVTAVLSGLVLNEKGLERGMACGVDMFCMGVSASETHSRKNTGKGTDEAIGQIVAMAQAALKSGKRVQASIQSAFGCGFEGPMAPERVLAIVDRYLEAGIGNISLADTAGHAHPPQVEGLYGEIRKRDGKAELACHFHNTYGLGLANCYAAMRAGVTYFEAALGGLGGCPFTKVAAGNVCSEDLVHSLQRQGLAMEIDLDRLTETARDLGRFFGRELPGFILKAGSIVRFRKTP
ncbi:MAG: hydroxymethylglutaryl-CoA lyase [Candidatus Aminicenantes bacterium]|nr:hydroxymethylglutaryl-CoA lyase [Candidatus Aminicenantes bacterium]